MRRVTGGVGLVMVLLWAAPAAAQSLAELTKIVKNIQAQIDTLRARTDGPSGPGWCDPVAKMCSWIDSARVDLDGVQPPGALAPAVAFITGWALRCGDEVTLMATAPVHPRLDVLIDGLPVRAPFQTVMRDDVSTGIEAWCDGARVPPSPGVIVGPVSLTNYAPGEHQLQLRLTDSTGRVQTSNIVTVTR
jgi:hypothetical protein